MIARKLQGLELMFFERAWKNLQGVLAGLPTGRK